MICLTAQAMVLQQKFRCFALPLLAGMAFVSSAAQAASSLAYDGQVEAIRQTVIAAQVPGAVVALPVQAGQRVVAGQLLAQLDDQSQRQNTQALQAQVQAAEAQAALAQQEFRRQQLLFGQQYISQAALDRARAQLHTSTAQHAALRAQVAAAQTQIQYYRVRAPYAAMVSEVQVSLGDLALPGRPLLALYDPSALRASVAMPQSVAQQLMQQADGVRVQVAGQADWSVPARQLEWLPVTDPQTQTRVLRVRLPSGLAVVPGQPVRVQVSLPSGSAQTAVGASAAPAGLSLGQSVWIPATAVVQRAELTAVYVVRQGQAPLLRQVRLGERRGTVVEVLSGLSLGERVLLQPQRLAVRGEP